MSEGLEEIGGGLERFLREYNKEMLRVSFGEKPSPSRYSIIQDHAHLFDIFTISEISDSRQRETGEIKRRTCNLERYLQKTYPLAMVSDLTDRVEEIGSSRFGTCGPPMQAMEDPYRISMDPDRESRAEAWQLRDDILREMNPLLEKRLSGLHKSSRELGYDGLGDLCLKVRGLDLSWISDTLELILDRTESLYLEMLEDFMEPTGVSLEEMRRHDVLHLLCGREFDPLFPAEGTWNSLSQATSGLGTMLGATGPIRLRSPGCGTAHHLPVSVPREVYLFMEPKGGFMDYILHFGEAGRAIRMGMISSEIPMEYRWLGDPAASESSALLLQRIISTRPWLKDRGDEETVSRFRRLFYLHRIFELRRLSSLLLYELRLNMSSISSARELHRSIMEENMHFRYEGEDHFLEIVHPFRSADRIRGFIFEAMLRKALLEKFGEGWYRHPSTKGVLGELWTSGGRFGLEELSNCIGYAELDMEPLVEEIEDRIRLI